MVEVVVVVVVVEVVVEVFVVVLAVVVVVVISSCRRNHTSVVITKCILKRTSLIHVDGKDISPTSWMRRLICVFTECILLYGFAVPWLNLVSIFKVFSDHHTQMHTRTRWHHSVNRGPGYRKYPTIDIPKVTALIGFERVIVIKVWFCYVDILKYQCKGREKKVNFDIVN